MKANEYAALSKLCLQDLKPFSKFSIVFCSPLEKDGTLTQFLYLIVLLENDSAASQASVIKPWFVFWRNVVELDYLWRDQTSLTCTRGVQKRYDCSFTLPKSGHKSCEIELLT